MNSKTAHSRSGARSKIAGFIIIILSILLAFNIIYCVRRVYQKINPSYLTSDAYTYEYYFKSGDYLEILDQYERCVAAGADTKEDALEYIAIAQYYQAASLYYAAQTLNDADGQKDRKVQLDESYSKLQTQKFLDAAKQIQAQFQLP